MKNDTIHKNEVNKLIDIVKAKETFKEYVKNYDLEDKRIQLKVEHIERTSQIAKKISIGFYLGACNIFVLILALLGSNYA